MSFKVNGARTKRGQVTIFVIVAIVIVVAVVGILYFRGNLNFFGGVPTELQPAYTNFIDCLEGDVNSGVDVLGSQGGYIYTDELEFKPGSTYMPFSSQLDFLGSNIPYWY